MWNNSESTESEVNSIIISDSENEDINASTIEPAIIVDSSDDNINITPEKKQSDTDLCSSFITESTVKRKMKVHKLIYSDEENTNSDSNKSVSSEEESEIETSSNDNITGVSESNYPINRKRKDVSHNTTRENIKDLKASYIYDSSDDLLGNDKSSKNSTYSKEQIEDQKSIISIGSDSASSNENSMNSENAMSFAKQEIGVGNIDPIIAQKRAILSCKLEQLTHQLAKTKLLLQTGNIEILPDKGKKLKDSIAAQEKEIQYVTTELENTPLLQTSESNDALPIQTKNAKSMNMDPNYLQYDECSTLPGASKELGKKAQETLNREFALTVDRLQDLHGSLVAQPSEDEKAEDPSGLKVKLMPHQQHALAWLMWREQQRPAGGVLADDMGLGKTLTMISLIIATLGREDEDDDDDDDDDEWIKTKTKTSLRHKGGTLVVCPASLLSQWENEILNRCKKRIISVEVYHGSNREKIARRLATKNVVITTYNILTREFKTMSTVYQIHWKRIILDEAHVIRNHKSQASEAVCGIFATKRWALTGTPIQNKELDLYSLLKFLRCSPFDDIRVWKRWVDNKNVAGHQRLATVMKTLMLRRTKIELQEKGALSNLPDKCIQVIDVNLDHQEQLVYEKVLIYSRTLFAQFLAQRAEKDHMIDLSSEKYDKLSVYSNQNKNMHFTKAQNELLSLHADVKAHEILVLLLRLRQICCHPALIHAMLDQEDLNQNGFMDEENVNSNFLTKLNNMSLNESIDNENEDNEEIGIDHGVTANLLTSSNPVFESKRISSKMKAVLKMVEEILQKGDKLIIVSQWTSMLKVVGSHLSSIRGARFREFTGSVPIKDRQDIMDAFNDKHNNLKILLLSLTAGGVGLNLVGGNHLLLIDIHWNPQLETQAQDRIYRFGQEKDVFIYKFICKNTIEERITQLQERKLEIAQNVLSGEKNTITSKLTLNDLKSLFAL